MEYIAHINKNNGKIQTVKQHSENTASLCREYAVKELKDIMYNIGLLHDLGKYRESFQKHINGDKTKTEHSTLGAKLLNCPLEVSDPIKILQQLCIVGHHTGIPNCGNKIDEPDDISLYGRLKRPVDDVNINDILNDISVSERNEEINKRFIEYLQTDCKSSSDIIEKFAFLVRYCFSCLVDADTIDTIQSVGGDVNRSLFADFDDCYDILLSKLTKLEAEGITSLQKSRAVLQKQAFDHIKNDAEIYLMNMPTGSGKTLAGLLCALERVKNGKKRIIYVIPYNSIINQTAEIFEKMFKGKAQILRHQSTFSYNETDEDDIKTIKYASENWDAQIIITTSVQFFESIYSNKRSKLRKLHNLGDSILVFDEAHLMPIEYLEPCLKGISYITKYLNSEAIFLTATMPDFSTLIKEYAIGSAKIYDLITDKKDFSTFKKCEYVYIHDTSDEALVEKTKESPSCLIVVNSRKTARKIFSLCSGRKYHLSTYMTSYDRERTINEIKTELENLEKDFPDFENVPDERRVTVVSTSLIEAGVDLDFYSVYRELAGLDNILQAGGRCNREGKRNNAFVYVFSRIESKVPSGDMGIRINITRNIIDKFEDISSEEAIKAYYSRFYQAMKESISRNSVSQMCTNLFSIPFADYSITLIDDSRTASVVTVRNEKSRELVENLKRGYIDYRELQKYCFSIYSNELKALMEQGVIDDYESGVYCLTNNEYYDENIGITFESKDYII